MVASYLSPSAVAAIHTARDRGFATRKAVVGVVSLLLWRTLDTGVVQQIGPQDVVVTFADRQPQGRGSEAVAVTASSGMFEREAPFDAQVCDRFSLPGGAFGRITVAPNFVVSGRERAEWQVEGAR